MDDGVPLAEEADSAEADADGAEGEADGAEDEADDDEGDADGAEGDDEDDEADDDEGEADGAEDADDDDDEADGADEDADDDDDEADDDDDEADDDDDEADDDADIGGGEVLAELTVSLNDEGALFVSPEDFSRGASTLMSDFHQSPDLAARRARGVVDSRMTMEASLSAARRWSILSPADVEIVAGGGKGGGGGARNKNTVRYAPLIDALYEKRLVASGGRAEMNKVLASVRGEGVVVESLPDLLEKTRQAGPPAPSSIRRRIVSPFSLWKGKAPEGSVLMRFGAGRPVDPASRACPPGLACDPLMPTKSVDGFGWTRTAPAAYRSGSDVVRVIPGDQVLLSVRDDGTERDRAAASAASAASAAPGIFDIFGSALAAHWPGWPQDDPASVDAAVRAVGADAYEWFRMAGRDAAASNAEANAQNASVHESLLPAPDQAAAVDATPVTADILSVVVAGQAPPDFDAEYPRIERALQALQDGAAAGASVGGAAEGTSEGPPGRAADEAAAVKTPNKPFVKVYSDPADLYMDEASPELRWDPDLDDTPTQLLAAAKRSLAAQPTSTLEEIIIELSPAPLSPGVLAAVLDGGRRVRKGDRVLLVARSGQKLDRPFLVREYARGEDKAGRFFWALVSTSMRAPDAGEEAIVQSIAAAASRKGDSRSASKGSGKGASKGSGGRILAEPDDAEVAEKREWFRRESLARLGASLARPDGAIAALQAAVVRQTPLYRQGRYNHPAPWQLAAPVTGSWRRQSRFDGADSATQIVHETTDGAARKAPAKDPGTADERQMISDVGGIGPEAYGGLLRGARDSALVLAAADAALAAHVVRELVNRGMHEGRAVRVAISPAVIAEMVRSSLRGQGLEAGTGQIPDPDDAEATRAVNGRRLRLMTVACLATAAFAGIAARAAGASEEDARELAGSFAAADMSDFLVLPDAAKRRAAWRGAVRLRASMPKIQEFAARAVDRSPILRRLVDEGIESSLKKQQQRQQQEQELQEQQEQQEQRQEQQRQQQEQQQQEQRQEQQQQQRPQNKIHILRRPDESGLSSWEDLRPRIDADALFSGKNGSLSSTINGVRPYPSVTQVDHALPDGAKDAADGRAWSTGAAEGVIGQRLSDQSLRPTIKAIGAEELARTQADAPNANALEALRQAARKAGIKSVEELAGLLGLRGDELADSEQSSVATMLRELSAAAREISAGLYRSSGDKLATSRREGVAREAAPAFADVAALSAIDDYNDPSELLRALQGAAVRFTEAIGLLSRSEEETRRAVEICAGRLAFARGLDRRVEESLIDAREKIKLDKIALFETVDEETREGFLALRDLKTIDDIMEDYSALDTNGSIDAQTGREANADAGGGTYLPIESTEYSDQVALRFDH